MATTIDLDAAPVPTATGGLPTPPPRKSTLGGIAWGVFGFGLFSFVVFVAYNLQSPGQMTERIANPNVTGAPRTIPNGEATAALASEPARNLRRGIMKPLTTTQPRTPVRAGYSGRDRAGP